MDFHIVDANAATRPQNQSEKGLLWHARFVNSRTGFVGGWFEKKPLTLVQRDEIVAGLNMMIDEVEYQYGKANPLYTRHGLVRGKGDAP